MLRNSIRNSIRSFKSADGGLPPFSFGNALQFDGVNDFVGFSNIPLGDTWAFACWFNLSSFFGIIISDSSTNFIFPQTSTIINVRIGSSYSFTVPTISTSTWYHLAVSTKSSLCRVYLNGVESSTGALTIPSTLNLDRLGARASGNFFNGILNELAVWGTDLTNTQISDLYNSGNGDFATNYQNANLIAYWRCNEEDGATTLTDEQGAYNGTLNNFSTPPAYFIPH